MNIKVLGTSFTLTSSIKLEDIKRLKKFQPEGLVLKDKDNGVIFAIGAGKNASINSVGVEFNAADKDGFAQASFDIPTDVADKAAYIQNNFGLSILRLGEVEENAAANLVDLEAKFARVGGTIEIVG